MAFPQPKLHKGVVPSRMLGSLPDGTPVEIASLVACRQQPCTAKGFVFLTLEDEFGLANVIMRPDLHERQRREGTLNVLAERFGGLGSSAVAPRARNVG